MSKPQTPPADAAVLAQRDLQSTLLRSTIICATSIQSLREPVGPDIIAADAVQLPPLASQLSSQILSDLVQILKLVQKHCNALSLALRPPTSSATHHVADSAGSDLSPVTGLDAKSLEAAKAQIVALSSDLIPKMVFIAKKAWKDRQIFQVDPELVAQQRIEQQAEKQRLEQLAKSMGGQVMSSQQLGLESDGTRDAAATSKKCVSRSLGNAFAREVRAAVEDVLGCLAELLQSFLDSKTKAVLQQASNARARADGLPITSTAGTTSPSPKTAEEARRTSLQLNNLVWESCAKYIGQRSADGGSVTTTHVGPNGNRVKVHIAGLSKDNLEASKRIWQERAAIMRDGLDEMKQATEGNSDASVQQDGASGFESEADLGEALSAPPTLSAEQRKRLSQLSNLVKVGNILHESTLKAIVSAQNETSTLDLDRVEELASDLELAQDELVAAALYGEEDAGIEELGLADDEDQIEHADEGAGNPDPAVEEGSVEAAVLRTLQQYVRAAVALVSFVTGNEEDLKRIDGVEAQARLGNFQQIFEDQFSRLSKILTDIPTKVQVRSAAPPTTRDISADIGDEEAARTSRSSATATASASAAEAATASSNAAAGTPTSLGAPIITSAASKPENQRFRPDLFVQELQSIAQQLGKDAKITDRAVAETLDKADPLASLRDGYLLPRNADVCHSPEAKAREGEEGPDAPALYMCGNSLGPLSKLTRKYLEEELDAWGRKAVLGHFDHPYGRPWTQLEARVGELTADIVGAKPSEVAVMGTLTGNLHTMLTTFYRPAVKPFGVAYEGSLEQGKQEGKKVRHKIVYEHKAFPSDRYALASAIELNGFSVDSSLIPLIPEQGTRTLETTDILAKIDELGREGETSLILLGGIQYFTGQFFELEKIAAKVREYDILFGVDLAHAFANVPLKLHDWGIDFAVWCTYKYGSSGPGGIAGLFVHNKWTHSASQMLTRQAGWWGHDRSTRFSMPEEFAPIPGAEGWQVSNPSMLDMTALRGSLETLNKATEIVAGSSHGIVGGEVGYGRIMPVLRSKSLRLTGYLESLLLSPGFLPQGFGIEIVTPRDPLQRGSQLCIRIPDQREVPAASKEVQSGQVGAKGDGVPPPIQSTKLIARAHARAERERGLVADICHPDMLRIAPLAQYSTFTEVWRSAEALRLSILEEIELEKAGQV